MYHPFQFSPLPAKCLGILGFVPDGGISQFQLYFGEPFLFLIVVKGTPSALTSAPGNP
jgi:hypothetical protein